MSIEKVKCNGCAREFDEDKINCLNGERYLCHDCGICPHDALVNIVNSRKSEMFLKTCEQNQYIAMIPDNVKALYGMIIELEEYHKKTSELILRIRKHMDYFKINWESENDL